MTCGKQSANLPIVGEQLLFSFGRLVSLLTISAFILSCSTPAGKIPAPAQNSLHSSPSALRIEHGNSDRLQSLALKGDAEAQYQLAKRYATGDKAIRNYAQASYWWHLAARQGLARAQYALGVLYANGRGIDPSDARAVHWYRQAAEQGLAEAQYNLGMHYWLGRGVSKDAAVATNWLRKAAEQNLPQAQYNLALLLERGIGATRNLEESREWYARAAAQGLPAAQHELMAPSDTLPWKPTLP